MLADDDGGEIWLQHSAVMFSEGSDVTIVFIDGAVDGVQEGGGEGWLI